MPPTNLLFVFADQMRGQAFGAGGNRLVRTPNIDRIAREGVRVTNAVSSYPVCSPYRASLLTGNHAFRNGMYFNDVRLPEHNLCAGSIYADAGYRTGYIGKWHLDGQNRLGWTPPGWRRRGFEHWAVCNCSHAYFDAFYYTDSPNPIPIDGYEPDGHTDLAVEFLEDVGRDPFCLFVSYGTPHNPLVAPEEWLTRYRSEDVPLRPNVRMEPSPRVAKFLGRHPGHGYDPPAEIAAYYGMIANLDHNVGRLLAVLERTGALENTLVVFTSDHGDMLGSHGEIRKQRPWEESILVPFVARGPGIPAGRVTDVLLSSVDVLPTALSLTGVPNPADMDGQDLAFALRGEPGEEPESAYIMDVCAAGEALAAGIPEWRGVRTKSHSYVRTRDEDWLLYDNRQDPYQLTNLVADAGHDALRFELRAMADRWREELEDVFETGDHYLALAREAGPACCPSRLAGPDLEMQAKGVEA